MKTTATAILAIALLLPAAMAAPTDDVTEPIRQFIDGFNNGDTNAGYAAYASGNITIIDEFAPHLWTGRNAAHAWAADFDKHAQAAGVSAGSVKYGNPTRTEVEGDLAYVVIPTVYVYQDHGTPTEEEGQMTFVLQHGRSVGWKIRGWTWTGAKPHPR